MSETVLRSPCAPDPAVAGRLLSEGLISLADAVAVLPPVDGHPMSINAVVRWIRRGKAGVCLEALRLHDEWWTSLAALARFAAEVTASA